VTRAFAAAIAGLVLLAPAQALAGSASCILQALPAEKRALVDQDYAGGLDKGMQSQHYTADELAVALKACSVELTEAKVRSATMALAAVEFESQTRRWLLSRPGVTAARIDAGFRGLPARVVADVHAAIDADGEPITESLRQATNAFVAALGLDATTDNLDYAVVYLAGRLVRERLEPQF